MDTVTLTAVVTSHNHPRLLASILGQLRYQTRRPDEVLAYVSRSERGQTYDLVRFREEWPDVTFIETENFRDWGHSKRAMGIEAATSNYVGFFDDDDRYARDYVEKMLGETWHGPDVVYCNWSYKPEQCTFEAGHSTSGNFIIRVALAREVGWKGNSYIADGDFITRVKERHPNITHVRDNLYAKDFFDRGDF